MEKYRYIAEPLSAPELHNPRWFPQLCVSAAVLRRAHLQNVPAVADPLVAPGGDDAVGAGAARPVVQPGQEALAHGGRQDGGGGGPHRAVLERLGRRREDAGHGQSQPRPDPQKQRPRGVYAAAELRDTRSVR